MVAFFCNIYRSIGKGNNKILGILKYYAALRLLTKCAANIAVPVYFMLTARKKSNRLAPDNINTHPRLIVSLTTFPARIGRIWIVIECMIRQQTKPDKIILWLSEQQFDSISKLPKRLQALQKRGLEIRLCKEDLRSHKKYYYTLKEYPGDILITVDDDFIYPPDLIGPLVALSARFPDAICCHRALRIATEGNRVSAYRKWKYLVEGTQPSFQVFQTSGGGTLYPPGGLSNEALNEKVFMELCKNADDIWLNMMAQMNHVKTVKASSHIELIPLLFSGNISLSTANVGEGQNDVQLEAIREFYIRHSGKDPFVNLFKSIQDDNKVPLG